MIEAEAGQRDAAGRIVTARLRLRQWQDSDRAPFAAMGRDPRVMAYFPTLVPPAESNGFIDYQHGMITAHAAGLWAIERLSNNRFMGFCGVQRIDAGVPVDGEFELQWRLEREHWGQGFATEAGRAALWVAFGEKQLSRVLAVIVAGNERAASVALRLGMTRRAELDFEAPALVPGHRLSSQIVYGIDAP